jgi:hypothetical protein
METFPEYFNEYISNIIQTSGLENLLINYIEIREEYYRHVQPRC